jgi:glutathionyl-hydroquinone reductase
VRFDAVNYSRLRCKFRCLVHYPNLWGCLKISYQRPGVAETGDHGRDHGRVKRQYHGSHKGINPTGIVPKEPVSSCDEQHGRERLSG